MKVMIDTNIFISAALFPNGRAASAFLKALVPPYQPLTCDYVVDELHRKFREKFANRITELDAFLFSALSVICMVPTPEEIDKAECSIRDPKDRAILRAALSAKAELLLTGDKDFLEAAVEGLRVISVSDFLAL